jgi:predicted AlkP superfamily pyrophosphatase or phosphodiesterase
MKRCVRGFALLLVIAWFCTPVAQAEPRKDQCVILVTVDGLADFYLDEAKSDMPTLRRLAREGARGHMVCSFPTVTWPNHTSLITGATPRRHGVVGNSYLDRQTRKSVPLILDTEFDKEATVRVPTLYDAAHQAGLKTCGICWPASRSARTLDLQVPDMFGEGWDRYATQWWLAELRAEGLPVDSQGPWAGAVTGGVMRDWMYCRMAAQALRKHQPNLMLVHLVEMDHVEHRHAPRSPEAYWCASFSDDRVRDLVEAIDRSPLAGRTTLVVCGDHGFFPIERDIRPNVLLAQLGLVKLSGNKVTDQAAWCLSQGGGCAVYVLDTARRAQIIAQLREALPKLEGVQAVFGPEQFAAIGQPTPAEDPRAPDMWIAAKRNYSFSDTATGKETIGVRKTIGGTHGYLPTEPDLIAACVMWGPRVKPGTKLGTMSITDVAPTIAQMLGVTMPKAEGKALTKALR